jgi:hypothetical protein
VIKAYCRDRAIEAEVTIELIKRLYPQVEFHPDGGGCISRLLISPLLLTRRCVFGQCWPTCTLRSRRTSMSSFGS